MIIEKFEELAQRIENKIAVKTATKELTYGQLNRLADEIARALVSQPGAAGAQQVVALLFDHGIDAVVSMLAALKARQIYVPLDSTYPVKRLQYMLVDSGSYMILTNSQHLQLARQLVDDTDKTITILNIDEINQEFLRVPGGRFFQKEPLCSHGRRGHSETAYILYTSGSSGKPKGVVQRCDNLYFYTRNYIDALSITAGDRNTFLSSLSHDGAIQDIYGALLSGATLYPLDIKNSPASRLLDWLAQEKITLYHSVPTVFRYVTGALLPGGNREFPDLRLIVTGGEPLKKADIERVRRFFPAARLAHMYGQTESSVNTMGFIDTQTANPLITMGEELPGIELILLDQEGEEVDEFETGEIFVASNHIALGYCNDPVNTKKAFFYDEEMGGIYRSGDLGRRESNDCVAFLGRKDNQVKIRGNRVDPSEIENALRAHKKIKDAVVIPRKESKEDIPVSGTDNTYLTAFCVPAGKSGTGEKNSYELNAHELRNYLSLHLPDYMIPLYFEEIEKIPLSPTGKLDRDQLPLPGAQQMVRYLIQLLRQDLLEDPLNDSMPRMDIAVLPGEKRKQLLLEPDVESLPGTTLHGLFEQQAAKTPGNIAVMDTETAPRSGREIGKVRRTLTYKQLNESANQLAGLLREKKNTGSPVVGLMVEPSLEMVIGMLAILKSGGVYLPLDPGWPQERLTALVEEYQPSVLLTKESTFDNPSFTALQNPRNGHFTSRLTKPRSAVTDIDSLPIPDRSLVDYETYSRYIGQALVKNSISLQATRGCPYDCAYCHKIWHKNHRVRSAENIFSEVKTYYDMGIRRFAFIDDVFNLDRENSTAFFQLLIKNKLNRDARFFFPNGLRGDILTREYIDLMIEAGTAGAALALETASPRLQKLIGKHLNPEKLEANLNYITHQYPSFILELFTIHGFPSETQEEALMTLDFIKRIKWLHFPYVNILRIYSNTDMEKLAIQHGISKEAITRAEDLAFHQLPNTLPFAVDFTLKYQADFLRDYFLHKERLLQVLPHQMKVLTEDEMVQKYNSYLDTDIRSIADLLEVAGLTRGQLGAENCLDDERMKVPHLNKKMKTYFLAQKTDTNSFKVLLLDLSQLFEADSGSILYDLVEPPLGLIYIMSYLQRKMAGKVTGKIAKSRIDFNSFNQLKTLIEEFQPGVIGIRTLTLQKHFFHKTTALIRQWGVNVPVITGGPYATTNYETILKDPNVDLVVLGEGEVTFSEIIEKIMENQGKLPAAEVLMEIPGIAFVPARDKSRKKPANNVILLDEFTGTTAQKDQDNPVNISKTHDPAAVDFDYDKNGIPTKLLLTHGNMTNLVLGLQKKNPSLPPLTAAVVFDPVVEQVFGTLVQGGTLYIAPANTRGKGIRLFEAYGKEGGEVRALTTEQGVRPFNIEKQDTGPTNEVEEKLLEIWAQALDINKTEISIDDNFFQLGGHSLKALMVISTVHKEMDVLIPVATILQNPTIKGLAAYVKGAEEKKYTSIEPVERKEYYPLSSAQKRLFVHQQIDEQSTSYNLPKVLKFSMAVDKTGMEQAFQKLIKRHDGLRTSFGMIGDQPVQKIYHPDQVEFSIQYHEADNLEARSIIKNFVCPFDLTQPPLLRVGLIKINRETYLLVVDMHHIISDLASLRLLIKDFIAVRRGEQPAPLKLQYKDYSEWQNNEKAQETTRQQEVYWLEQFPGKPPVLELSTDYPRPAALSFEGDHIRCTLDTKRTEALTQLALQEETTMYTLLLTIFYVLLAKLSSQEDIVIGSPTVGRRHADLGKIMGIFINMLPLRSFPAKEKTFHAFLAEVKQLTLDAFENQDYPFERLVEKVSRRDAGRSPLFDVMFEFRPEDKENLPLMGETGHIPKMENTMGNHSEPLVNEKPYLSIKSSIVDLILFLTEVKGEITLNLEYSTKLYKRETAAAFLDYYKIIADSVIENKQIKIKQIELVEEDVKLDVQSTLQEDIEEVAFEFEF